MSNKNSSEELQSRREFFKKAAKVALPVVGAIALSQLPLSLNATEMSDCNGNCSGSCRSGCYTTCYNDCYNACKTTCKGACSRTTKY